jgi:hypothetical protein
MRKQRQWTARGTGIKPKIDAKRTLYMFKRCFIQNNRDSYKEETKIPPPNPHKRKILITSLKRIHIFACVCVCVCVCRYPVIFITGAFTQILHKADRSLHTTQMLSRPVRFVLLSYAKLYGADVLKMAV